MLVVNSSNIKAKVFAKFAECGLTPDHKVAAAFSGGGDSTALLALMLNWCKSGHVYAFIIDHALRENSHNEAKLAEKRALAMGAQTQVLTCEWPNGIPTTGIQEKARNGRYQLLGDACRALGIDMLMLGHNQDDQAETVLMRRDAGSGWRGLAGMGEQSLAPVWPALWGVSVVRPMLDCGRDELRGYNLKLGLKWIEDPSNENCSFARIRARKHLSGHESETQNLLVISKAASQILALEKASIADFINNNTKLYAWGGMTILPFFYGAKLGQCAEALKYLLPAISGHSLSPAYDKRMHLARRLRAQEFSGATLGGVRFVPDKNGILCVRDLGALLGRHGVGKIEPMNLKENDPQIWDGRFIVSTAQDGTTVDALGNWAGKLDKAQKNALAEIPEPARSGIPVFIQNDQTVFIPFVDFGGQQENFSARALTNERLSALLGE